MGIFMAFAVLSERRLWRLLALLMLTTLLVVADAGVHARFSAMRAMSAAMPAGLAQANNEQAASALVAGRAQRFAFEAATDQRAAAGPDGDNGHRTSAASVAAGDFGLASGQVTYGTIHAAPQAVGLRRR